MFNISSKLKLYRDNIIDEDMLEKIFFIFHASNVILQWKYREKILRDILLILFLCDWIK